MAHQRKLDDWDVCVREDEVEWHKYTMVKAPLFVFPDLPSSLPAARCVILVKTLGGTGERCGSGHARMRVHCFYVMMQGARLYVSLSHMFCPT